MKRFVAAAMLSAAVVCAASQASAGIFADDLGRCLVGSTSPADKTKLVVWIFSAMTTHPDIKQYSNMTADQRAANNQAAADIFIRLLTVDCRSQTQAALQNEGAASLGVGFKTLGEVAMTQLMQEPSVGQNMTMFGQMFSQSEQLKALLKQSGMKN